MSLRDTFLKHVCQTSPFASALEIDHAEGCWIWDASGRKYLDFISGISVMNVGHSDPRVVQAVVDQMRRYAHTMVYGEHVQAAQVEFAEQLAAVAPAGMDTVYFVSTGAEANDTALKAAVKLTGRSRFIAFHRAYHGDTVGALSCFGSEAFRRDFAPLLADVQFLKFGDETALGAIDEKIAAVLVEPVQGEAGIIPPPEGFLAALRQRCSDVDALLIFDEVQTGLGRVGDWFAATMYGVTPDLMTLAKALGGGLPLGAVIGQNDLLKRFACDPPFSHITTFGGNPVSCAAGLAALQVIRDENLLANSRDMGAYLIGKLQPLVDLDRVLAVRGVGLMIGLELRSEELARNVVLRAKEAGVIFETTLLNERVIRLSPPLIVSREQCDVALESLAFALGSA